MTRIVNWVYRLEDIHDLDFVSKQQLIITTGFSFRSDELLLHLLHRLVETQCSGVIFNTGKYLTDLSPAIVDYCNQQRFPLLTMPWDMHITDISKDFCRQIYEDEELQHTLADIFSQALTENLVTPAHVLVLEQNGFFLQNKYCCVAVNITAEDPVLKEDASTERLLAMISNIFLYLFSEKLHYCLFSFQSAFLLVFSETTTSALKKIMHQFFLELSKNQWIHAVKIGIGTVISPLQQLSLSYEHANIALKRALSSKETIIAFDELGIYQLIFSIHNQEILLDFYKKYLYPLQLYDSQHHTDLMNTLQVYLDNNANIHAVSACMYLHRNTVSKRLNKIKEILNLELTAEDCFHCRMAFYIYDSLLQ